MTRTGRSILCLTLLAAGALPATAFPAFLEVYQADPLRNPAVDGCVVCHVNPAGGGPRNDFGLAFADNGLAITPLLRSQFSERFTFPSTPLGDTTILHFSDPDNAALVVEVEGVRYLADLASSGVAPGVGSAPETPARPEESARDAVPVAAAISVSPVDAFTSEGAFFGPRIVNLPSGKGMERGGVEFLIGHRFTFPVFDRDSPANLFGFDSSALVTFGVQVGLTDWMSVAAMRSNLDRTTEFTSQFQLSSQKSGAPVSTQLRLGVEGRNNFQERFAPFVQFVSTRSFGDRFSISLAPSIAFNTRNEESFLPPQFLFGEEFDYTAAIGIGAGIGLTPSVSVVGEYVPRVKGFTGEIFDRPAVSLGIQKATFRHTFEFVLSTARPLTTAQYTVNGSDTFKVGFNIYRRLR